MTWDELKTAALEVIFRRIDREGRVVFLFGSSVGGQNLRSSDPVEKTEMRINQEKLLLNLNQMAMLVGRNVSKIGAVMKILEHVLVLAILVAEFCNRSGNVKGNAPK